MRKGPAANDVLVSQTCLRGYCATWQLIIAKDDRSLTKLPCPLVVSSLLSNTDTVT